MCSLQKHDTQNILLKFASETWILYLKGGEESYKRVCIMTGW